MPRRTVLSTARLVLTTWLPDDIDDLFLLHSDPQTTRYVRNGRPDTRAESIELLGRYLAEQVDPGRTKWRLADERGSFVGRAGFGRSGSGWELGYTLRRDRWGEGLATEIASALVTWHRGQPTTAPLTAFAAEENAASLRVLAKAGFTRIGRAEHSGMRCVTFELPG
ncbi:GNAT family N-acetyltransferase [uncultured Jatrophihabitans sp.]|uniref:GNAT family N-acetyltransferase n=1 Tax=uncultured Jatrophihabitans sp. TaxID=1610747 RepID=UPI0035C9E4B9